jgi:nucleoid DNA-binding protein
MTKTDLIEGLSNKLGLVKIDAERVVDGVLDAISEALKQGDRVNISGFGTFAVSTPRPGTRLRFPLAERQSSSLASS